MSYFLIKTSLWLATAAVTAFSVASAVIFVQCCYANWKSGGALNYPAGLFLVCAVASACVIYPIGKRALYW